MRVARAQAADALIGTVKTRALIALNIVAIKIVVVVEPFVDRGL